MSSGTNMEDTMFDGKSGAGLMQATSMFNIGSGTSERMISGAGKTTSLEPATAAANAP